MIDDIFKIETRGLGKEYYSHEIFDFIDDIITFYEILSMNSNDASGVILANKIGINSIIYSSIQGTIESIKYLSTAGRLNDVFALARKLDDAVITDLFINILIKQDELRVVFSDTNIQDLLSNSKVRKWILNKKRLYRNSEIANIKELVYKETDLELYNLIEKYQLTSRGICNDNVHYNSLTNFAINNYEYIGYNNKQ